MEIKSGTTEEKCSLKFLTQNFDENTQMSFPVANSVYTFGSGSGEIHMSGNDVEIKQESFDSSRSIGNALTRNVIPSVSHILESVSIYHPRLQTSPSIQHPYTTTPYLLPNPTSYYNPLNPRNLFGISNLPTFAQIPSIVTTLSEQQHQSVTRKPFIPDGILVNGQAATVSASDIHFPLSESPAKVAKRQQDKISTKTSHYLGGNGPPLDTTDNATTTNRFILVEQPNDIQRKSYKKENRCLLPNPLIVCRKELSEEEKRNPPVILDGVVALKLVNNDGTELPPHKQNALESIEGGLSHPLGDDQTTCFSVKVLQTSEGNLFRLVFHVSYRVRGVGRVEEQIVSRPFAVYSNKHNRNSRKKQKKAEASAMSQQHLLNFIPPKKVIVTPKQPNLQPLQQALGVLE